MLNNPLAFLEEVVIYFSGSQAWADVYYVTLDLGIKEFAADWRSLLLGKLN